jgi:mRNA interferase HigB
VHVISYRTLRDLAEEHPESLEPLKAWHKVAGKAKWLDILAVKAVYPHADAVGRCTVFNVGGNDFRLVVQIDFEARVIYIRKVMTHAEYSRKNGAQWKKSCNC